MVGLLFGRFGIVPWLPWFLGGVWRLLIFGGGAVLLAGGLCSSGEV